MSKKKKEEKTITLNSGEYLSMNEESKDSMFKGVNLFLRNNGDNVVKVVSDTDSLLITVEKPKK